MPQYQGVWTLEQQAQAQSNQQWVTDPNFKNTTLLLQADGTGSGSQNQTFLDGSTNNFFITRNGNTTQGSFSPFSQAPGYWGNYFGSSSNYLVVPANSNFVWSTGARTYEAWVYVTSVAANNSIFGLTNLSSSNTWELYINTSSQVVFRYFAGGAQTVTTTGTVPLNTWAHVAFVYDGTSAITIYINGVISGTGTKVGTPVTDNNQLCIGRTNVGGAGDVFFTGYISNVRFTTTTVYTSAFTPQTTPLTAITNTTLLTCQSNAFVDNSASPATITANGTVSVQAFGPFAPALQWTPDVVGGSAFFDGVGDYLSWSGTAAGAGAFSYEFWLYSIVDFSANRAPLGVLAISGYNSALDVRMSGTTINMSAYNVANNNFTVPALVPNTWYHVVLCRNASNQATVFLNGVRSSTGAVTITQNFAGLTTVIGAQDAVSSPGERTTGYLTGIRLIVGSTPYDPTSTTITVPTAPVTAITNTSLLTNYTNAGIYDGKMGNNLETVGNAQVATSPVKYGSGSMAFDGSGDYLVMPQSPTLSVGSGNFTYEMWLFPTDITDTCIFDTRTTNNTTTGFAFLINGSSFLAIYTNSTVLTCTTPIASGVWQHVAVVRSNGILYVYLNGVSVGSAAFTNTLSDKSFRLGAYVDNTGNYNGYIDDMRLTNGLARYFTTFTPPQQALPRQ